MPAPGVRLNATSYVARRSLGSSDYEIDLQWLKRQKDLLGDKEFARVLTSVLEPGEDSQEPLHQPRRVEADDE
jgi:hypothetical protein